MLNLLRERGLKQAYLIDQLGTSRATFIRKRKEGTFTYKEIKTILNILGKIKAVSFEDLASEEVHTYYSEKEGKFYTASRGQALHPPPEGYEQLVQSVKSVWAKDFIAQMERWYALNSTDKKKPAHQTMLDNMIAFVDEKSNKP